MSSTDSAIQIQNLSKCYNIYDKPLDRIKQLLLPKKNKPLYREFWALNNISFEVKKGETFGIIGRNGSGKSTLLQLICRTLTPTSGEIITIGKIAALLELGAGFNPEFSGIENVYINGAILGFTKKQLEEKMDTILAFADIGDFIHQPVKTYSSGMFVRLAFAVQACVEPDILLIDEALAVGDVFFRQKCYKFLNKLLDRGTSILLVSHSMNEVEQFCNRAILLQNGCSKFLGPANEAVKHYYLIEQRSQNIPQMQQDQNSESIIKPKENPLKLIANSWPEPQEFLDISKISQVNDGWAKCTGVAVCNDLGKATLAFEQGSTASFYYEFEILQDIEVPAIGILIKNDRGIIVHGKGSIEYGSKVPICLSKGQKLRVEQNICLEIAVGEYTYEVGLAHLSNSIYNNRQLLPYEELYSHAIRLCHLPNVNSFTVLPRINGEPVQLLHHGVANLKGSCRITNYIC